MLYDIDVFGFVSGYISKTWNVMSEKDLLSDKHLSERLMEARYQSWKRHNVLELREEYEGMEPLYKDGFEKFCREVFCGNIQFPSYRDNRTIQKNE